MKVKALRNKDTKEFVYIEKFGENYEVFTSSTPKIFPMSATIKLMRSIYPPDYSDFDFKKIELVEFDLIESGEVGADIRNKLSPPLNLVNLLEIYFDEENDVDKEKILEFIKNDMEKSKESIEYISNLL